MKRFAALSVITLLVITAIAVAAPDQKGAPEFVPQLTEDKLTKIVLIRRAPDNFPVKPDACDNDGVCEPTENWKNCPNDCAKDDDTSTTTTTIPSGSACYDFLAGSKPKWNTVEDYYYSVAELELFSSWATGTWNDATSDTIFGSGISGDYPWGVYDYRNAISYGDYSEPNVIAVTAIWFRGKNIYEYDILFDTDYFPVDGSGSIDLDTVALHEFGHAAGLGDLYNLECSDQVMYGYYAGVKHDLRSGDIAGIQELYGP